MAAALAKARTTSVLFVGETIIDEYQYCESLGKSGKEPVLAVRYVSEEKFAGGVLATANQTAAFCDRIGMLTLLGGRDSHEEFVREKLDPKIDASFLYMPGARTIVKRRMVEIYPFQKLFEVYFMDPDVPEAVYRPFTPGSRPSCRGTTRWWSPTMATACSRRRSSSCSAAATASWR